MKSYVYVLDESENKVALDSHWMICEACQGEGQHSNPSIDGNGISTSSEIWADDDFRESYMSGAYDISCSFCNGSGKMLVALLPDECPNPPSEEMIKFIDQWWDEFEEKLMSYYDRRYGKQNETSSYYY